MGSISNYLEIEILDHVFQGSAPYTPPTIYIALSTADPLDDGTGLTEPSGNGYARIAHSSWNAAASRSLTNNGVITFAQASGDWGTITHYAISDAPGTGAGNMLAHGSLASSKTVVNGNTPSITDTDISISFNTGGFSTFLANELLDHVFGNGTYTSPSTWLALTTSIPTDTNAGTEASGNNYGRVECTAWDIAVVGATENTNTTTFPTPSGDWGTCVYCVIMSASVAGDYLAYGDIADQTPALNDTVRFLAGALDVTLD